MTTTANELVEIVDRDNRPQGGRTRKEMRDEGLAHRACYILVENQSGQLFVQKRTKDKDIYPGYWDIAAGGVVLAGESYELAAHRELREELGIEGELCFLFDHYYHNHGNQVWGRVFLCRHEGPFVLQTSEIEEGCFLSMEEVTELARREPVTPDGIEILDRYRVQQQRGQETTLFLHGLDSSGQGTKGQFFAQHFPHILRPDFVGSLEARMARLEQICTASNRLTLVGSSFGGLMATLFAARHAERVARLVLLAPALNYGDYRPPRKPLTVPTTLVIGKDDTVTPPHLVLPLARATFDHLSIELADDDHMLHATFPTLAWHRLLL